LKLTRSEQEVRAWDVAAHDIVGHLFTRSFNLDIQKDVDYVASEGFAVFNYFSGTTTSWEQLAESMKDCWRAAVRRLAEIIPRKIE
jgi:hypothetical protein